MALFMAGAEAAADVEPAPAGPLPTEGLGRPRLWQVLNTYVLAETRDGLLIIDQHSAHERDPLPAPDGRLRGAGASTGSGCSFRSRFA